MDGLAIGNYLIDEKQGMSAVGKNYINLWTKIRFMSKVIEVVYKDGVFKPLQKVELKGGERVKIRIERRVDFKPIKLKKQVPINRVIGLRDELWTSS